ncbi:ATP-binding protein, partial [Streptomyces sp. SID486]|uniref:ATP-binding protein n=1 Tax=Streptomyces sp. SID486 TaxID=2690264 RepID=UPI0031F720AA
REAVTNVVRHSRAGRCEIRVNGTAERVRLTVTDDGTGAGADDAGGAGTQDRTGAGAGAGTDDHRGPATDDRAGAGAGTGGNGRAGAGAGTGTGGTGLKGLTERLAAAGGCLTAGPAPRGGFTVVADLPVGTDTLTPTATAPGAV